MHAQTATSTTSPRLLTICLIRQSVIPPTDGKIYRQLTVKCCAHKARYNIFGEQPKISASGLDFLEKVRYHRINFPNREHLSRQRQNEQRRLCSKSPILFSSPENKIGEKKINQEEMQWKENIVFRAIRAAAEQALPSRIRIFDRSRITEDFRRHQVRSRREGAG